MSALKSNSQHPELQSLYEPNEVSPDVCRLCLFKSNILKSMFHCSIGSQTYADIYESCTGYSVIDNTQLPHRICNDCEEKLVSHHNFRLSIDDVEEKLQAFQMQFEQKIEKIHQDNDEDIYVIEQLYEEEEMLDEIETNDEEFYAPQDDSQDEDNAEQQYKFEKTEDLTCRFVISEQNSQNVKCKSCNAECPLEASINEIKSHVDFPITCECEKVFKNRRSFTRHYSIIHQKKESSYPCRDFNCTEVFRTWRSKVTHEANKHNIGLNFSCSSCEKKFYRRDHWKDHEKSCNKSVDSSDKFFSCAICLFTFQREDTFRKHLQTAHVGANEGDTEYSQRAEDYAQKYSKSRSVVVEAPAEESDKQSPTCKVCNKMFKNHISLSKHMSSFHSNQGWACDKCDAVFVHRSTKLSHMSKEHGSRKPFECTIPDCGFSCFKKDRFTAHLDKHDNPEKKFPCPICQQEFKSYNTMTLHRAKHLAKNTFICTVCSKQFLDKRNFNVHFKLHTGEGLHNCNTCRRGFNRKDHLQKHQKRKNHFDNDKLIE